jgi:hypothetical protein
MHGGGEPGGSGAHDEQVVGLVPGRLQQPEARGHVGDARGDERLAVGDAEREAASGGEDLVDGAACLWSHVVGVAEAQDELRFAGPAHEVAQP